MGSLRPGERGSLVPGSDLKIQEMTEGGQRSRGTATCLESNLISESWNGGWASFLRGPDLDHEEVRATTEALLKK